MNFDTTFPSFNISVNIDSELMAELAKKAQLALDLQIMADMEPLMPFQSGTFKQLTVARSTAEAGTGRVTAAAPPFGRFLYYGKVMVDPVTGSPFARAGVKKIVTDRDLKFWYPCAQNRWFEVAKESQLDAWKQLVIDIMEGKHE